MKIAILGLGSIGRRHLGNFRSVGVETLSAYDAAPAQREAAAKDFPFASIATTADEALAGADGAVICTPPESHIALGRAPPRYFSVARLVCCDTVPASHKSQEEQMPVQQLQGRVDDLVHVSGADIAAVVDQHVDPAPPLLDDRCGGAE